MKSQNLFLRAIVVTLLVLALLVPLALIRGVISERASFRNEARERVAESMAGPQQFVGPLRVFPYKDSSERKTQNAAGEVETRIEIFEGYLVQPPQKLSIVGELVPGERRIGLFPVRIFEWRARVVAEFEPFSPEVAPGREFEEPYLAVGVADPRGIVGAPNLELGGAPARLIPGVRRLSGRMNGVHAELPALAEGAAPALDLALELVLLGTQTLGIAPIGDVSEIEVRSTYPHPLFSGSFLPTEREIGDAGFSARYAISSLATSVQNRLPSFGAPELTARSNHYGARGVEPVTRAAIESVDVSLVEPVDIYTQSDRAGKYGILFVALAFVGFFLFETSARWPIHPLQYLLVGASLALFFLLLVGLSEHVGFGLAYAIAASASVCLQAVYLSGVLGSWSRAGVFAGALSALYGALYGILRSEDYALLMGSALLFSALSAIMLLTRRLDWYALGKGASAPLTPLDHAPPS